MESSIISFRCSLFRGWLSGTLLIIGLCLPLIVSAHPADITPLRVKVEKQRLEFHYTFTLLTLGRIVVLDANGDQRLDTEELEACQRPLTKFLQEHVLLRLNDKTAKLGGIAKFDPLWPKTDSVDLLEVDRAMDVVFILPWPEVIANVWMEFTGFPQLGDLATIQATYEQGDLRMQVPFSPTEPDYRYDTGFAVEEIFQAPVAERPTRPSHPWAVYATAVFVLALLPFIFRKPTKG